MSILIDKVNPIFEAIHYIMNRVNNISAAQLMKDVISRHPHIKQIVSELWEPAINLERALDEELSVSKLRGSKYFSGITPFPTMFCVATVLLEPTCYFGFITDIDELKEKLLSMSEEDRINHTISSIGDTTASGEYTTYKAFIDTVIALNIDDSDKMNIISAYNSYEESVSELIELVRPFAECVERNKGLLEASVAAWKIEMDELTSIDDYIEKKYHFSFPNGNYIIFPTFMNCILIRIFSWQLANGELLGEMLLSTGMIKYNNALHTSGNTSRIVGIIKGLADETRFDLLRYINRESSYGKALADKFNMTQQKVFYHMLRMQTPNIVECNAQNGKTYYSINQKTISELIDALKEFVQEE